MLSDLGTGFDRAEADGAMIVLRSGRPGIFSAGFELNIFAANDAEGSLKMVKTGAELALGLLAYPLLTIGLMEGHAFPMGTPTIDFKAFSTRQISLGASSAILRGRPAGRYSDMNLLVATTALHRRINLVRRLDDHPCRPLAGNSMIAIAKFDLESSRARESPALAHGIVEQPKPSVTVACHDINRAGPRFTVD
jgi:hypothetical protein